jgi:hypothetical protein
MIKIWQHEQGWSVQVDDDAPMVVYRVELRGVDADLTLDGPQPVVELRRKVRVLTEVDPVTKMPTAIVLTPKRWDGRDER